MAGNVTSVHGRRLGLTADGALNISPKSGNPITSALVFGAGSSTTPVPTSTADKNFLQFYTESTATSGDSRGIYLKHFFEGAGGSGEAACLYGVVNGVTAATLGTVNGAHISLAVSGTAGKVSGAGNALKATLELGANTVSGGTLSVAQLDSYVDTDATIPARTAFIRMTDTGAQKLAYGLRVPTVASAGVLAAHTTAIITHSLRCIDEAGTTFYLMGTTDYAQRTGGA